MSPLESAAFDCIYDQLAGHNITPATHYTVDLAQDIIDHPLIADTGLSLEKFIRIIGQEAWQRLLGANTHPNTEKETPTMETAYSSDQLAQGREAWLHMAEHKATYGTLPSNFKDFFDLPLEVKDPSTGDVRVVLIRNLSAGDIQDWSRNYEIEVSVQRLTGN